MAASERLDWANCLGVNMIKKSVQHLSIYMNFHSFFKEIKKVEFLFETPNRWVILRTKQDLYENMLGGSVALHILRLRLVNTVAYLCSF